MQTASPAFAAALLSSDQTVAQRVLLTLPAFQSDGVTAIPSNYADVTGCVVSISGDGAVTTTVPEGTLLINGYSAAAAQLVLSGFLKQAAGVSPVEGQTVFWLFNPHDPTSPMYRLPRVGVQVTLQEGRWVGGTDPEWVTTGTLVVDTCACSGSVVTLTLIDGRNSVRGQATLPPVITTAPYNAGLTSEYAVDYLLRNSSPGKYYSWPALHNNCLLAVGCRSSIWPEVGSLYPGYVQGPVFQTGMHGTGLGPALTALNDYSLTAPLLTTDKICGHFLSVIGGLQLHIADAVPTVYEIYVQRSAPSGSSFLVNVVSPGGTVTQTISTTGGAHEFEFSLSWPASSTAVTGTVWVDGTPTAVSITAANARPVGKSFTVGKLGGPIEGVQITNEASYTTQYPFTPTLILDPSLNPLTALPDVTGKDRWGVLQDIAAAEAAVIMIDEVNVAHFVNRATIGAKSSTLTVSSRINLTALDSLEQLSTVATHVQVPVNPLMITPLGFVWSATSVMEVPASGTLSFIAQPENIALNVQTPDSGFAYSSTYVVGNTYWRGNTMVDGTGISIETGIHVTVEQLSARALAVTVTNDNPYPVQLCSGGSVTGDTPNTLTGVPGLIIGGQAVVGTSNGLGLAGTGTASGSLYADSQWPAGDAASNPQWGEILLQVAPSDWRQDVATAQGLSDHYLRDFLSPRPLIRNTSMVSDPRLQLLDRITLVDSDVNQINADALVVGVHTQYGGASLWTRTLDLRLWNPPGMWVLGVSKLGVDTYI